MRAVYTSAEMSTYPRFRLPLLACLLTACLAGASEPARQAGQTDAQPAAQVPSPIPLQSSSPGSPFTAAQLSDLLPATVYFQGKTAPLQIRNSGGTRFLSGAIAWAALVDTSGYASSVQERYQFYLVTEGPLRVGNTTLAAGAYGGGFMGDRFIMMDLGGHTVAQGSTLLDANLARPRPLQILPDSPDAVRLYLGRRWMQLQADPRVEAR